MIECRLTPPAVAVIGTETIFDANATTASVLTVSGSNKRIIVVEFEVDSDTPNIGSVNSPFAYLLISSSECVPSLSKRSATALRTANSKSF